jgi:hypothetical protein
MRFLVVIILGLGIASSAFAQGGGKRRQGTPVVPTNRLTHSQSVNVTGNAAIQSSQQPACLHGVSETPIDAARRREAIVLMRAINTAQAQAFARGQGYRTFRELTTSGLPSRPAGFLTQLTVEGQHVCAAHEGHRRPVSIHSVQRSGRSHLCGLTASVIWMC